MVVREDALNQLQSKGLPKGIQLQEPRLLRVREETQVLKHGVRVVCGGSEFLSRTVRQNGLGLSALRQLVPAILVHHLVHHEHNKLP